MAISKYVYSENAQRVIRYLQKNSDIDLTGKELAAEVSKDGGDSITARQITGIVNGLVKKDVCIRVLVADGDEKVKVIRLTDGGLALTEEDITEISPKWIESEKRKAEKAAAKAAKDSEAVGSDENVTF